MMLSELLQGYAEVPTVQDCVVYKITDDSREVKAGTVFFACRGYGEKHAASFAAQAVASGAVVMLWDGDTSGWNGEAPASLLVITIVNLAQLQGDLAARFYQYPSRKMWIAAVTGTDGKTSVAWMLAAALKAQKLKSAMLGTTGNGLLEELSSSTHTTLPALSLQKKLAEFSQQAVDTVAMEVSSHALDQARTAGTEIDCAVFTYMGRDHLDYHLTETAYQAAKRKLFTDYQLQTAIINADDAWAVENLLKAGVAAKEVIAYGQSVAVSDYSQYVRAASYQHNAQGLQVTIDSHVGTAQIQTQLLGDINVYNVLVVLAALLSRGESLADAAKYAAEITAPPGRMEKITAASGKPNVVVDYAHTPGALQQVLATLKTLCPGQLTVVFGCGGDRDAGKRPLMGKAASMADKAIVTTDNARGESPEEIANQVVTGMTSANYTNYIVELDRKTAITNAIAAANDEDWVLIAGKGHEDYQIIGERRFHFSDREVAMQELANG